MTIAEIVRNSASSLEIYSDAPELDAQRLVLHVIKQREPSYLLAHGNDTLSEVQLSAIRHMHNQRKTGMPLAYILGEADFYGRTFIVTPDVLIPRPDTETLIEKALEYIKARHSGLDPESRQVDVDSYLARAGMTITIADICTGSGCIAITLVLELQKLQASEATSYKLVATDISPTALAIAKQNAEKHGVQDRIEFLQGDMLEPIKDRHVDLIVSNPPYVPTEELAPHFALRVSRGKIETIGLDFEPRIALDGGADGLDFVRQIQASKIPSIIETLGGEIITTF